MNEIKQNPYLLAPNSQYRKERLIEKIQSCPATKRVYGMSSIIRTSNGLIGNWEIVFNNEVPFPASYNDETRTIRLDPFESEEQNLSQYLFELINLSTVSQVNEIRSLARNRVIGKEDFAKALEYIEFCVARAHHFIISQAIEECGWPESMDHCRFTWSMEFKKYWNSIKNSPHTEFYREQWQYIQRAAPLPSLPIVSSSHNQTSHSSKRNGFQRAAVQKASVLYGQSVGFEERSKREKRLHNVNLVQNRSSRNL